MPRYWVGCSGWSYDDWRGPFYAADAVAGEYLSRYARVFDVAEVDSSFYRPPTPFLVRRWATQTPADFRFTLKIPQAVTHKPTADSPEVLARFLESLGPLADAGKLGPLVAQFPPGFHRTPGLPRLTALLDAVPRSYRLAVELRHRSWWTTETLDLLTSHGAALVWSVYPGVTPPFTATADFLYARFVGDRAIEKFDRIQRDRRGDMEAMARHFREEGASALEIYALVNNHFMGFGPGSAQVLREVLGLPPLDLTAAQRAPGQSVLDSA
ncbi:MAG TPA: DUF72 domain-containing protein [Thermoplasmata archaeon]|nr:DUF72 domain-containing protein [Thermoplasmata archaeon]